ncbi:MAG: hypothetical protein CMJ31_05245 [Phycisphaerae bacterium]|nr:hypothetical protein [Phycisphaerae bacterium]
MKKTSIAFATVAALAAGAFAADGPNLLENGGFESSNPLIGGFENWDQFNNVFAEGAEIAPFEGTLTCKMFGNFGGPGVQTDSGCFQTVDVADAAGKTFRLTSQVLSPEGDSLQMFEVLPGDENFGHLAVLIMDFVDAGGTVISGVSRNDIFTGGVDPTSEWLERSVEAVAPEGTAGITAFLLLVQFGSPPGAIYWDAVTLCEVEGDQQCSPADYSAPFGTLDIADVVAFLQAFGASDPASDLAMPFGTYDIADVVGFLQIFGAGCPE